MEVRQKKSTRYFCEGIERTIASIIMLKTYKGIDNDGNWDNHDNCDNCDDCDNHDNYNIIGHTVVLLDSPLLSLCLTLLFVAS